MTPTQTAIDAMRESFSPDVRSRIGGREIVEIILCDRQRADDIATGKPYYDYDRQCWVNATRTVCCAPSGVLP